MSITFLLRGMPKSPNLITERKKHMEGRFRLLKDIAANVA